MSMGSGSDLDLDISLFVFASIGLIVTQVLWSYLTPQQYHPGPRRLPWIGNALQIPRKTPWITYKDWSKIYGPCIHLDVVGLHVLVVNEYKDAEELLGKRGTAYAERPHLVMAGDLVGFGRGLALLQYDKDGKESRKMILNTVGARNVPDHQALLEKETLRYLRGIRDSPERAVAHLTYSAGAIILKIAYGYSVQPADDPLVALANNALDKFSQTTLLGEFPVDLFPILRYVPSWIPGVKFKKLAREWKQLGIDLFDKPFDYVKSQMKQGTAVPSFSSQQLEQLSEWNDHVIGSRAEVVKLTATSLYAGASDTTVSAMRSFYLAMTIYPEIQAKARAEIEAVLGSHRLPTLDDRADLPYCNRLVKEVLRWGVVGPLGIPHVSAKDDVYQGYKIPKGTVIVANIWAMLHDETRYPDPELFNPDRFLDPSQPDPAHMVFGFGRRICPGLHFAQAALFLSVTQTLALFQIKRVLKDNGEEEIPEAKFITGMISHPESFRFNVVPLSPEHMKLIDESRI